MSDQSQTCDTALAMYSDKIAWHSYNQLNLGHSTTDMSLEQKQMSTLHFEILPPIKIPLIKRFYKEHYTGTKPKSDDLIVTAYESHTIVGVVRFRHVATYRLLTGMAVAEEKRYQGIGSHLLSYCRKEILSATDYCFAYQHLESFYQRSGFTTIPIDELPAELKTLYMRYTEQGKSLIPMHYLANNA